MNPEKIREHGYALYRAQRSASTVSSLTDLHPEMTIEDAYRIQQAALGHRQSDGERVIGKKIGVTSEAVQRMLNVHQPDFGFLTDWMLFENGRTLSLKDIGLIQPRVEGELAFVLKDDLPASHVTREAVLAATEYVIPCFEVVDSRIRDWKIKIQDTVADNASCGVFVLGDARVAPESIDLAAARLDMYKNGQLAGSGFGTAVQGHPAEAVAWLANTLGAFGIPLRKGEVILSGSLTPLVPVAAGDMFELSVTGIGTAAVGFSA
ncbi:MAG TPA: fumarylacetoacetate hydrolase family protein [Rhodocyclaceae bacterium]|nr:fumarylacetoacetate hydrolase family protein [Rhodocyclaceae bacterium]